MSLPRGSVQARLLDRTQTLFPPKVRGAKLGCAKAKPFGTRILCANKEVQAQVWGDRISGIEAASGTAISWHCLSPIHQAHQSYPKNQHIFS